MLPRAIGCLGILACALPLAAQAAFETRLRQVIDRPEYKHSRFGVAVFSLDGKPLSRLNENQLFVPGSTTKLLAMGTALKLLGPDRRFATRLYRTGDVSPEGTLNGDIVVLAGGDLNLSGRIQSDGTLAFRDVDHSYASSPGSGPVPGDPVAPLREMARQVARKGIKRITGQLYIDISLFPSGERELGTGVIVSPIVVNDNVIDVFVTPGKQTGDPASVRIAPLTAYVNIVSSVKTGPAGSKPLTRIVSDESRPDGGRSIVLEGSIPPGPEPFFRVYKVPDPVTFARFAFREVLAAEGVLFDAPNGVGNPAVNWSQLYTPPNLIAEHLSPPFIEDAKFTLKVSQNLHASTAPFLVGSIAGGKHVDALDEGFKLERKLLEDAGLDTSGAMQSDGAGGDAMFTPAFMCQYLIWLSRQPYFEKLRPGLPVLGTNGSLWDIQTKSPAAGKVYAKTGTYAVEDRLHQALLLTGKGLAGYTTTRWALSGLCVLRKLRSRRPRYRGSQRGRNAGRIGHRRVGIGLVEVPMESQREVLPRPHPRL